MTGNDHQFTRSLRRYADGDASALDEVMEEIYGELRRLARGIFGSGGPMTIQPTVLVHEAWLRLAGAAEGLNDKQHFLAVAARAMRQVLANHVRDRGAEKRGSSWKRVTLHDEVMPWARSGIDLVALHEALSELEREAPRRADVAQLRCFSGMTIAETASVLDIATSTVEADWALARAWLRRRLADGGDSG